MILNINTPEGLAKAHSVLVSHFKKSAAFHKAKADHHEAIAKAHGERAAFVKGQAEGMDNEDKMKAYVAGSHDFHKAKGDKHAALASLHKAHAEHLQDTADALEGDEGKAAKVAAGVAAAAAPAADANAVLKNGEVAASVTALFGDAVKDAVANLKNSNEFKKMVEAAMMEQFKAQFGNAVVPSGARGVMPQDAPAESRPFLIPRHGSAPSEDPAKDLDPMLKRAIGGN